jgi:hypothetical protein
MTFDGSPNEQANDALLAKTKNEMENVKALDRTTK